MPLQVSLPLTFSTCTLTANCHFSHLSVVIPAALPCTFPNVLYFPCDTETRRKLRGVMIEVYRITRTADKLSCYSSIPPALELAEHSLKIDQFKADKRKRFFMQWVVTFRNLSVRLDGLFWLITSLAQLPRQNAGSGGDTVTVSSQG